MPAHETNVDRVAIDDIRTFTRVFNVVKRAYVDSVDDHRLMQAAIEGLLTDLDPHSAYLDRSQLQQLSEDSSGAYTGIGITVAEVRGQLSIIAPLDGTPADRAGLQPGDVILGIDGEAVQPDNIDAMVDRLRGPAGSPITLLVAHPDQEVPQKVELVRERIHITSVRSEWLAPGYALLRISEFQAGTPQALRRAIEELQAEGSIRGAVLDLRSNPGGLLKPAVGVSDLFLEKGNIVSTRGRLPEANMTFAATAGDVLVAAPLVVLIDSGTASAAEIVAGALKDHHRGVIMGQRSFGKGSVQSIIPLDDQHAVKITTARYYTPDGTSIQAEGIVPDIRLADLSVSPRSVPPRPVIREADLPHHLDGADADASSRVSQHADLAIQDYALSEALNVLQGMALAERSAPAAQ